MASELLLFLFSFFFLSTFSNSFVPFNNEVEALIAIKSSLYDPHGALSNWDEDSVDPCSWAMITCSSQNLVVGLGAPSQVLSGTLSGMIGNLTNLEQILLQNNNITGEIPPEIGTLSKLETLDLSNNKLSGSIPNSLGRLSDLRYLRLNNNSLSGEFPTLLSKLPLLSFLDLSYNNLSGRVPTLPARTFNAVGNPLICGSEEKESCWRTLVSVSIPPMPSSLLESPQRNNRAQKLLVPLATSFATSFGLFCVFLIVLCRRKWRRDRFVLDSRYKEYAAGDCSSPSSSSSSAAAPPLIGHLRRFSLRELQEATEYFNKKNIVGRGGFGDVYRGRLSGGEVVAVKRLKDPTGVAGKSQFLTEVEMISLAVHRHVLRLVGYCECSSERLLVYPFMHNGSVASRVRGKPLLGWSVRQNIAVGAARGLVYLHEQCDPKIIHRDVKAANVLLDDRLEAVIGDLGLAKLLDHGDSHVTTAVRGTVGHIAPEYLSTGQSSDKTDVFGFGILLLELLTGRRSLDFGRDLAPHHRGAMLDWVRKMHMEKKVELLVDGELGGEYDRIEAAEMVQVAVLCTQNAPADRPKMSEVLRMLEGDGHADKWEICNRRMLLSATCTGVVGDCGPAANGDEVAPEVDRKDEQVKEMELSGPR